MMKKFFMKGKLMRLRKKMVGSPGNERKCSGNI